MSIASFYFYAELNDFLSRHQKQLKISRFFEERASIKDMIEALGVPHPEVDSIEVNGEYVNFSYIVQNKDTINVYPISARDVTKLNIFVLTKPLNLTRFVLDIHLGKLATSLRLLGFDTLYRNDYEDRELADISSRQARIILTRDKGLLMRSLVTYGYYVRNTNPQQQVLEVLRRFDLFKVVSPFQRCLRCNGLLEPIAKQSIIDKLPETVRSQDEFNRCQDCGQIYWKGSHYERLQKFVDSVLSSTNVE